MATTAQAKAELHQQQWTTVCRTVDCLTIFSITFYEFYGILQQSLVLVWNNFLNRSNTTKAQSTPSTPHIHKPPVRPLFKTRCDKYHTSSIIQRTFEMWKYLAIVILWASIQCRNDPLTNSFGRVRQRMNIIECVWAVSARLPASTATVHHARHIL